MAAVRKTNSSKGKGQGAVQKTESHDKRPPAATNNIRNWRLFRGIATQKELAVMTIAYDPAGKGLPRVSICRLETGEVRYNQDHIDILSRTLRVSPRDLIGTNPYDAGDIFAVYAGLSEAEKRKALKLVTTIKR